MLRELWSQVGGKKVTKCQVLFLLLSMLILPTFHRLRQCSGSHPKICATQPRVDETRVVHIMACDLCQLVELPSNLVAKSFLLRDDTCCDVLSAPTSPFNSEAPAISLQELRWPGHPYLHPFVVGIVLTLMLLQWHIKHAFAT